MKIGLKKLFNKKKNTDPNESAPKDPYTSMNSNSLYSLPVSELVSIIFKYDQEVKSINQDLATTKDQYQSLMQSVKEQQGGPSSNKDIRDNAQYECHRLARELNESVLALASCQAQLTSRDSLLQTLKSRIVELEKQNCELQLTGIQFTQTDEIDKLKSKLAEYAKQEHVTKDLISKNQTLEKEIKRLSTMIADGREQVRVLKEKSNIFENAKNEMQAELSKRKNELDELKVEIKKILSLKETFESENRSLKDLVSHKETSIQEQIQKFLTVENSNADLQHQVNMLKHESEQRQAKFEADLKIFQEQSKDEKDQIEDKWKHREEELLKEVEMLQGNIRALEREKEILAQQLRVKQLQIEEFIEENSNLKESLQTDKNKRKLFKSEVLKLTQKLEIMQIVSHRSNESKKQVKSCTSEEVSALVPFKTELDCLYKTLIGLISEVEKQYYKIKIVDFTNFEKKMNNLVMMLHEEIEEMSLTKSMKVIIPQQGAKNNKGRTPIKLFSCLADQDETQPRIIPMPKKSAQPADLQPAQRRGSAK